MGNSTSDRRYMARAIRLAHHGLYGTDPNPRVGCVIVKDDRIVGEGWHARAGEAHAEIMALQAAGPEAAGATVYVSLEPCSHHGRTPPCAEALIEAGVARVVAAMIDPNPKVAGTGLVMLEAAGIKTESGLLATEAAMLNPGFISRMTRGRPYVRIKLAISLDGRTAMASGESKWITGEHARRDVQRLRARSSAILTGVGTILADDPSLTVRDACVIGEGVDEADARQPLRIIIDSHLSTPAEARIFQKPGNNLIVTSSDDNAAAEALIRAGAEVLCVEGANGRIDLAALMSHLGALEINEVLVEAGSHTCGALLDAGLVDEIVVYMAPHIMGANARGMFGLPHLGAMDERIGLDIRELRMVGADIRITAIPDNRTD